MITTLNFKAEFSRFRDMKKTIFKIIKIKFKLKMNKRNSVEVRIFDI